MAAPTELLARASSPEYRMWLRHVMPAAACSRPIRLRAHAEWTTTAGTDIEPITDEMPDGLLYVACKNRRASICPACAETYRADTYQLIKAGLLGGKGVPESVSEHPAWFVTFSAPSFGPVHSPSKPGRPRPCRPRRNASACSHGRPMACWHTHTPDDAISGEPLCRDCYDYNHQAAWNLHAGELWRRTTIAINRRLAVAGKDIGAAFRLSYAKVAEYQHRGAVHFHALIRLDGLDLNDRDRVIAPHPALSAEHVRGYLAEAARSVQFRTLPHPRQRDGWSVGWGDQLDIRTVRLALSDLDDSGELTSTAVAGYLAKYATKATEATGHSSRPITAETLAYHLDRDSHQARQLAACWYLGALPLNANTPEEKTLWASTWGRLQKWAHMLGYGGHFSTKSRRYSTTLTALREVRRAYQRGEQPLPPTDAGNEHQDAADEVHINVVYALDGIGWLTTGDAKLANSAAAKAREYRRTARQEGGELFA